MAQYKVALAESYFNTTYNYTASYLVNIIQFNRERVHEEHIRQHLYYVSVMVNPFTHIINSLRSLLLVTSIDWQNLLLVTVVFISLCSISLVLAFWRLRKETVN